MNKILNNLGLAKRAGAVITGEEIVTTALASGKVCMVFLANDAGINTTKKVSDKTTFYKVLLDTSFSSLELSNALGVENRKVVGITNPSFMKILKK